MDGVKSKPDQERGNNEMKRLKIAVAVLLVLAVSPVSADSAVGNSGSMYHSCGVIGWRLFEVTQNNCLESPFPVTLKFRPDEFLDPEGKERENYCSKHARETMVKAESLCEEARSRCRTNLGIPYHLHHHQPSPLPRLLNRTTMPGRRILHFHFVCYGVNSLAGPYFYLPLDSPLNPGPSNPWSGRSSGSLFSID